MKSVCDRWRWFQLLFVVCLLAASVFQDVDNLINICYRRYSERPGPDMIWKCIRRKFYSYLFCEQLE